MIPYALLGLDCLEEKPEPDYYVCTEGFDPITGGRFLSREEKQIYRRMELYDRIGKGEYQSFDGKKRKWVNALGTLKT